MNSYESQPDMFSPLDVPQYNPADPDTDPLKDNIVVDDENVWALAYRSASERPHNKYRDGFIPVDGQLIGLANNTLNSIVPPIRLVGKLEAVIVIDGHDRTYIGRNPLM